MVQNKIDGLPEGWSSKRLKDVARVFAGSAAPQDSKYYENGTIPFVRTSDLGIHGKTTNLTATRDKLNSNYLSSNLVSAKKGTVLFPKSGASILTNNRALLGMDAYIVSHLGAIYSNASVTNKYIYHFLSDYDLSLLCENEAYPSLKIGKVGEIEIPLPPLPEQERIVAKLDGVFERIDASVRLLEQNIADADAMAESVLSEIFDQGSIPKGWNYVSLCDACELDPKKSEIKDTPNDMEVSFVPMSDIGQESEPFLPKQTRLVGSVRKGYTYFRNGDVLFAKVTPCFENGKGGIAEGLVNGVGFGSSEYYVLRPKSEVLAGYVYRFVSSQAFRNEGAANMGGAVGLQRVKKEWLISKKIPLPPLPEQERIVAKLDAFFAEQKAIKSGYETKISELKALKSSILSEAFQGKI